MPKHRAVLAGYSGSVYDGNGRYVVCWHGHDRIMVETPQRLLCGNGAVQVAGIRSEEEARMLVECGVDFLGFPLEPLSGSGDATQDTASRIIPMLRHLAHGVLITYLGAADAISSLCRTLEVSVVQLHGEIAVGELQRLRRATLGLLIVKTLVVRGDNLHTLLDDVERLTPHVDAFLVDTFDEETGKWGATGKTHDWSISRRIVEDSRRPVVLAGGLTPENVYRAVLDVGPAGVDVHTGVEDALGGKNRRLVERFVEQSRKAFDSI